MSAYGWMVVLAAVLTAAGVRTGRGFGRGFLLGAFWRARRRSGTRRRDRL